MTHLYLVRWLQVQAAREANDRAQDPSAGSSPESAYPRSSPVAQVLPGCFMMPFQLKQGVPGWKVAGQCQRSCNKGKVPPERTEYPGTVHSFHRFVVFALCRCVPSTHRHGYIVSLQENLYPADETRQRRRLLASSGVIRHYCTPY
ncbi:hypothetical protein BDV10DRAFT_72375 [Aspergillus recurvatus]